MKLAELIKSVQEKRLTKDALEDYRDQMSALFAEMNVELADIEKEEALFMDSYDDTVAAKKVKWRATEKGQRQIVLKRYCTATKEMLSSLKNRLFQIY